jgi:Fe-S-cluster containining protein
MKARDTSPTVPCAGCTACCRNTAPIGIWPEQGDDLAFYRGRGMVEAVPVSRDGRAVTEYALRRTADGDCAFLGESGCTIYEHRPYQCRTFDCRAFYAALTRKQRRRGLRQKELNPEVLERAAELLSNE